MAQHRSTLPSNQTRRRATNSTGTIVNSRIVGLEAVADPTSLADLIIDDLPP
jgi:hypothetical protein